MPDKASQKQYFGPRSTVVICNRLLWFTLRHGSVTIRITNHAPRFTIHEIRESRAAAPQFYILHFTLCISYASPHHERCCCLRFDTIFI